MSPSCTLYENTDYNNLCDYVSRVGKSHFAGWCRLLWENHRWHNNLVSVFMLPILSTTYSSSAKYKFLGYTKFRTQIFHLHHV